MLFAYVGPETMMPLASVFAAAFGLFMMFGRKLASLGRELFRMVGWGAGGRSSRSRVRDIASLKQSGRFANVATTSPAKTPGA